MLKRVLVTAILAIAVPSVPCQPNQAADKKQGTSTQSQPSSIPANAADKDSDGNANHPKANTDPPKWYTALERPDWWLVLAAFSTLGVVCWQSIETRKAAQGAKDNAIAALTQIEFLKSKERAQLRIEFAPPEFNLQPSLGGYPVNFRITLDGTTRAYVLQDSILVYLSKSKRIATSRKSFGIARNLRPEDSPYDGRTLIYNTESFPEPETDPNKFHCARRGEDGYTLFADGQIYYRDIFGDEWILSIDRYWDTVVKVWAPYSSGRDDTHRKVEPRKSKSHNPN